MPCSGARGSAGGAKRVRGKERLTAARLHQASRLPPSPLPRGQTSDWAWHATRMDEREVAAAAAAPACADRAPSSKLTHPVPPFPTQLVSGRPTPRLPSIVHPSHSTTTHHAARLRLCLLQLPHARALPQSTYKNRYKEKPRHKGMHRNITNHCSCPHPSPRWRGSSERKLPRLATYASMEGARMAAWAP